MSRLLRPSVRQSRRAVLRLISLLCTLAVVAGVGLVTASSASAWAYAARTGSPGAVGVPNVSVADLSQGYGPQLTFLTSTGATAARSPRTTDSQNVALIYSIQRWNGSSWSLVTSQSHVRRLPAGQASLAFPALFVQPSPARYGYWRVEYAFSWATTTGVTLGTAIVTPDRVSDHGCVTQYRPCVSYPGYVYAGPMYGTASSSTPDLRAPAEASPPSPASGTQPVRAAA